MKKVLIFLLAAIYITLTSGVVVNIHYCMGKIAGVTYGHEAEHKCDNCGMQKKNRCCDTQHKLVKADSDHIYAKFVTAAFSLTTPLPAGFPAFKNFLSSSAKHFNSQYLSPPDSRGNKLSVHNSIFRI
ncbi:MAG TPA: hypothetical protein VM101_03075 [Flavitalea sp.]|nr:hypothetical protein [Flavitalea sp.]